MPCCTACCHRSQTIRSISRVRRFGLYSPGSIWRRRPADASAVLPYLAMSYLYKRSNRFWRLLIKYRFVHAVWKPLVHWTRWRHVRYRARLAASGDASAPHIGTTGSVVSASV